MSDHAVDRAADELQRHIDQFTPGLAEVRLRCTAAQNTISTLQRTALTSPDMRLVDALRVTLVAWKRGEKDDEQRPAAPILCPPPAGRVVKVVRK